MNLKTTFDATGTAFDGKQLAFLDIKNQDQTIGSDIFINNLTVEKPAPGGGPLQFTDQTTAAHNVTVTNGNGGAVDLTDLTSDGKTVDFALLSPTELVAYTGNSPTPSDIVFTVMLSTAAPNGSYDFVLDKPLDEALSGADGLEFTFNYTARDFDGSTTSGTFTVTTTDDAPMLTGQTTSTSVEEGALSTASGDLYGDGNDQGPGQGAPSPATLPPLVNFGADGHAVDANGGNSGFRFAVADGGTFDFGVKSHGQEVDYVTVSAVSETADGAEQTLTAWSNGGLANGGHEVFTLTLDGDGNYKFTLINPLDEPGRSFASLDLSRLIEAVDFDGSSVTLASGSFTIAVNDDHPSISDVSASVFEAGLDSATDPFGAGNHVGSASFATEASGSLELHFGADGPAASGSLHFADTITAANNVTVTDGNGAAVSLSSLTSHGAAVHFALLDADTLVAYTGATAPNAINAASVVFSLTLSAAAPNGSYDFVLDKPLDQALAGSDGLHFAFKYVAKDFDGSTASASLTVTAVDDLPVAVSASTGQVDESGLTSATDPFGIGTDPGAPTEASATIAHYGADGPSIVTTNTDTFGIHSQSDALNFDANIDVGGNFRFSGVGGFGYETFGSEGDIEGQTGATLSITDASGPFVLTSILLGQISGTPNFNNPNVTLVGLDAQGDVIASVPLTVGLDSNNFPATVFNAAGTAFAGLQLAKLELVPGDPNSAVMFNDITATRSTPPPLSFSDLTNPANNITVTDGNGNAVSLASLKSHGDTLNFQLLNPETLVAFTGTDAAHPVFTVILSNTASDGAYDFVLDKPLDEPPGAGGALNFKFAYTARDFDGDTASGSFTVSTQDDAPFAHTVSATMAENVNTTVHLTAGTDYGAGADGLAAFAIDPASATFTSDPTNGHLVLPAGAQLTSNGDSVTLNPGADFEALGVGESATVDVPYTVTDTDGSTATGHIVFTIDGVNQAPAFDGGTTSGSVTSATPTTGGLVEFADPDVDDTHSASFVAENTGHHADGTPYLGTFQLFSLGEAAGLGSVPWQFNLDGADIRSLAQGQTLQQFYDVTISDGHGGAFTKTVEVDIVGSNDPPAFTGGATSGSVDEIGLDQGTTPVTGSNTRDATSGVLTYTDPDLTDTGHTASASLVSAVWSGASQFIGIPQQTLNDLATAMTAQVTAESTNGATGSVQWTASLPDKDLDFLAQGETLTAIYNITVADPSGGSSTEAVTVTFNGANDEPQAVGGVTSGTVTEDVGAVAGTGRADGFVAFHDGDFNDVHSATFTAENNARHADGTPYVGTFSILTVGETAGDGSADWHFSVNESDIQFLAQGQKLQQLYDVTVSDGHGGSAIQKVEVDIVGTDDPPAIAPADKTESASLQVGGGTETASGAIHFTDVDLTDRPTGSASPASITYTDANGQNITQTLTQGEISTIENAFTVSQHAGNTNNGEVDWSFSIADNQLAFMTHGQSITLTETVTVDDDNGGTDTSTVTLTLSGPNHPPVITSAPETATIFDGQSLQPPTNLVVNGGFESGTGGWTYTNFLYAPSLGQAAHSGNQAVLVATYPSTNLGTIGQTITDVAGTSYKIDLWAIPTGGSRGNSLAIDWDGTTVQAWSNVPSISSANPSSSSQYVEYTANVVGTGSDQLGIVLGTGYYWYVDDVSVTQVTTPGTEQQAGAITFTDADAADTHAVSYVADGQNYLGTFTATLATDSTGGKMGAVDWSFSVADSALSSLGAQQTIVQTYTVSIDDGHGGVTQQNVAVDITNPDHAPVIVAGPTSAAITTNLDASASTSNLIQDGGFEATTNSGLGSLWTIVYQPALGDVYEDSLAPDAHGGKQALLLWTGTDGPNDVIKLSQAVANTVAGVSYTLTFYVENDHFDPANFINILWNGQNVAPLAAVPVSGFENFFQYNVELIGTGTTSTLELDIRNFYAFNLDDVSLVANKASNVEQTAGTIVFTDADVHDTHTVTVTPLGTGYVGTLTAAIGMESYGGSPGIVNWNYSVGDASIAGVDLTQTYAISIDDGKGGVTTQDVTVNINDHAPAITSGTQAGSVTEDAHTPIETASGAVTFTDADTTDTHSVMVTPAANGYFGTLAAVEVADSTGGGTGTVDWTYSVNDAAIQSLAAGQTVTQTYAVAINDGHGGTTSQNVTITLHGANDAPVLNTADAVVLNGAGSTVNLLLNPGFESSGTSLTNWGVSPSGSIVVSNTHHSGSHSADTSGTGGGTLSQSIATTAGELYTVSFWVEASSGGNGTFSASWNGTPYFSLTGSQLPTTFTQESFTVMGTGGSVPLAFAMRDTGSNQHVFLDDVSVAPAATAVTALIASGSGPNNVTDVDSGASAGIAITGTGGVSGTWFYTINGGANWTAFQSVSTTNALLLAANSSTEVRFVPTTPGAAGQATLTFNAWDQTTGTNGGTVNLTTNGTGGTTAFSTGAETASLWVGTPTAGSSATLTTGADSVLFGTGTNTIAATDATLQTTDSLVGGSGIDTLSLTIGAGSGYSFNFGAMAAFAGIDTVALAANPGQSVSLTFTNADIASGQIITVDASADTAQPFSLDASSVTDGGSFKLVVAAAELAAAPTIAGGLGTDVIAVAGAAALTDLAFAHLSGVEVLQLANAANSVTLGADAAGAFGGAGHTLTIDDTAGGNLTLDASGLTGNAPNVLVELTSAAFTSSDHIIGGAGTNTIQLTDAAGLTLNDASFTNVHGIEVLKVGGSGVDTLNLGPLASAAVGGAGHALTIDDTTGTGALAINQSGTGTSANLLVELTGAHFNATDVITGGSGADTIQLVDQTGIVVADAAFTNVTGIETLKVGGAADDSVTLGAFASHDVGGAGHFFELDDSSALGNLYVNAAAMSANLEVLAGAGSDLITGGSGNDTFFAGLGNDIFAGGLGNNTFAFNSLSVGAVQITDFNNTTRADQIQVSASGFGGGLTANEDVTPVFQTASNATFSGAGGGQGQFLFDTANHTLYYSANGTTGAEHAIAQIEAGVAVTPHDIHVVA
ncbi:MAG TPA: VCBS domain-containing protein [Xanthobacteraceae bacterium]|nr:VCBS domain-containing protein [Xanthobacteraceae bacterium]